MKYFILSLLALTLVSAIEPDEIIPTNTLVVPNGASTLSMIAKANEVFSVQLNGNPTTGYTWILENADQVNGLSIQPINLDERNSCKFIRETVDGRKVGVGGKFEFKFQAGAVSNELMTLTFVYKRAWETTYDKLVQVKVQIIE